VIDQIPPGDLKDPPFLDKHPMFSIKLRISVKRGTKTVKQQDYILKILIVNGNKALLIKSSHQKREGHATSGEDWIRAGRETIWSAWT
jgi:hypothetical protein